MKPDDGSYIVIFIDIKWRNLFFPESSGRGSYGGEGKFKWTIWQNGGRLTIGLRERDDSKCQGLFRTWRCTRLSLTSPSIHEVRFLVNLCNYWANCSGLRGQAEQTCPITSDRLFWKSNWNFSYVSDFFRGGAGDMACQRQTSVNCSPLGDIGRFWVKWEAN